MNVMDDIKQVIVVRKDLKLQKGKMAAQVAHAAIGAYKQAMKKQRDMAKAWDATGGKKVIVWVESEKGLFDIKESLRKEIPRFAVTDAGLTQLAPGTVTCLGIGPYNSNVLDEYTGEVKLVN